MFKKYRKLTAVVLSLALVLTGIVFTPQTAKAETAVIGTETTIGGVGSGGWIYSFRADSTTGATYTGGTSFDDAPTFNVSKNGWEWDDMWVKSPTKQVTYTDTYTVTLKVTDQASTSKTCWVLKVDGNDVYSTWNENRDAWPDATNAGTPTIYTHDVQISAGSEVSVDYGQSYSAAGTKAFELTVVGQNPPTETSAPETTTADPSIPTGVAAYNYYANAGGYQIKFNPVTGADSYKVYMDDSAVLATITESGATLPASTFSTYADDAVHNLYLTSVIGGVESEKSAAASVRITTKTNSDNDPTDIPRVYIVTNSGTNSSITKAKKTACSLIVKGGKDDVLSASGDGSIKLRGNSTSFADKKAYNITFNSKKSLMDGRNSGKKWCLLAAAYDKSLMRSKLGMHLGEIFDKVAAPEDHFVEVYLNGTLMGLYDMCEPADNGRADIDYDDSANSPECMFELEDGSHDNVYDRDELEDGAMYHNAGTTNARFVTEDLEDEVTALVDHYKNDEQINYDYNTYLAKLNTDLASNPKYASWVSTLDTVDKQIRNYGSNKVFDYIDVDSFVDMYLVNEVMNTVDFNYSSVKFYIKMVNGQPKVFAGCIWDFDLSTGNSYYAEARRYNQFRAQTNPWFKYLMRNAKFAQAVKDRFSEKARAVVNLYYSNAQEGYGTSYIDQMTTYMNNARIRNYSTAGWSESIPDSNDTDALDPEHNYAYSYSCRIEYQTENVVAPVDTVFQEYTYADHISYLKSFLQNHVQMLFDQWQQPPAPVLESDDLDITGYQMTASLQGVEGRIGFRNVFQFEPKVMGETITEKGLVIGLATYRGADTGIEAKDVYVGNESQYVSSTEATADAKLDYQMGSSSTASYYAITMTNSTTVDHAIYDDTNIIRAYAKTAGGTYVYSKPYTFTMYNVADYLYTNNCFTNEYTHNTIYDTVLNYSGHPHDVVDFDWGNIVVKP